MDKIIYAFGFSYWKRKPLRLCFSGSHVKFVSHLDQVPKGAVLAVWGMRNVPDVEERDLTVVRIEDGFLRSVGLGADLVRPLSWVVDWRGMYFDATRPSDLETLLMDTCFDKALIERAKALRLRVVEDGLTKYNVGTRIWRRPAQEARVILVPGQVESDASIMFGSPAIKTNLGLLQAVRKANPDAYVVYKPHPDVVAGLRRQGLGESEAGLWCDEIVNDAPMGTLLHAVDEVHCLTSLTGFEALLRGKSVTCYGQPFYSGWGLTRDIFPVSRRLRCLSLDELVSGALILYPRYMSYKSRCLVAPEDALSELSEWLKQKGTKTSLRSKAFRFFLRSIIGVR